MKRGAASRGPRRGLGIFGRLFLYLTGFTLFVLLLIWLVQILLLGTFYERTKYAELARAAEELSYFLEDESSLPTAVYDYASRYDLCISVYKVNGAAANELARSHVSGACAVHLLSAAERTELYERALQSGGHLSETYPVERQFIERYPEGEEPEETDGEGDTDRPGEPVEGIGHIATEESINAVSFHVVDAANGERYVLLLDSKLTPVSTVRTTLELQFLWLAATVLILALFLSFVIARAVSRPIASMSDSARRLATGDYAVPFVGTGFRETRELAESLNHAAVELSRTDTLQKELIANISHDLRTPLTNIKGYAEVMRDIPGENTPENMQVVIDETERMSELVSDLLDLSKVRSGSRVATPDLFDLTETVESTLARYEKLVEHEGYTITFLCAERAFVYADRSMILQVVYNLINNAINYTGEDRRVTVSQTVMDGNVRIAVTDTGEGIRKEDLPLIWDRYYKVDKVHRRATVGTGLGLSIVKQILELHGATYGVSSTIGKGSTFWFQLPEVPTCFEDEKTDLTE